jgi:hypothetical protein
MKTDNAANPFEKEAVGWDLECHLAAGVALNRSAASDEPSFWRPLFHPLLCAYSSE